MTAYGVSQFVNALNRTNLTSTFNAARGFTSFCPIDLAFTSLGNATSDISALASTLERHATNSSEYSTNFIDGTIFNSTNGYPILVTNKNGSIYLNDAKVIGTNFITSNGAMHVLDKVRLWNAYWVNLVAHVWLIVTLRSWATSTPPRT